MATFIQYGGRTQQTIIEGKIVGICKDGGDSNSHYTRLPDENGKMKKKNLGVNVHKAVMRFWGMIEERQGKQKKHTPIPKHRTFEADHFRELTPAEQERKYGKDFKWDDPWVNEHFGPPRFEITEHVAIEDDFILERMKEMLINDPQALAQKLGIPEIARLYQLRDREEIKMSDVLSWYLNRADKDITDKQSKHLTLAWTEFSEHVGETYVNDITIKHLNSYYDSMYETVQQQGFAATWIRNRIKAIRTLLGYAATRVDNPTEITRILTLMKGWNMPAESTPDPTPISRKDFWALYDAADLRWKAILLLSLNTASYLKDIEDMDRSSITPEGLIMQRSKTSVTKVAALWTETKRALVDYLSTRHDEAEPLFISSTGARYSTGAARAAFTALRKKAGVDKSVKFNFMRDGFASHANGCMQQEIDYVLGHSLGGDRDKYRRRSPEHTVNAVNAVRAYYFEGREQAEAVA